MNPAFSAPTWIKRLTPVFVEALPPVFSLVDELAERHGSWQWTASSGSGAAARWLVAAVTPLADKADHPSDALVTAWQLTPDASAIIERSVASSTVSTGQDPRALPRTLATVVHEAELSVGPPPPPPEPFGGADPPATAPTVSERHRHPIASIDQSIVVFIEYDGDDEVARLSESLEAPLEAGLLLGDPADTTEPAVAGAIPARTLTSALVAWALRLSSSGLLYDARAPSEPVKIYPSKRARAGVILVLLPERDPFPYEASRGPDELAALLGGAQA